MFAQLPSRKSVKKAIDKGLITVNGVKSSTGFWLKGGEKIIFDESDQKPPKPYHLDLKIYLEDDHIAVVYKPAGLLVSGNQFKTLKNAVLYNLKDSIEKDTLPWPQPVHRLDRQTQGLIIIAKTRSARIKLGKAFEERMIHKEYQAVVIGNTPSQGILNSQVQDKQAITEYAKISTVSSLKNKHLSILKLIPKTGRKHQLRIQLSEAGYPILGDPLYSPPNLRLKGKGLFLCATRLKFIHPIQNNTVDINISPPVKFSKRMENEKRRYNTYRTV